MIPQLSGGPTATQIDFRQGLKKGLKKKVYSDNRISSLVERLTCFRGPTNMFATSNDHPNFDWRGWNILFQISQASRHGDEHPHSLHMDFIDKLAIHFT